MAGMARVVRVVGLVEVEELVGITRPPIAAQASCPLGDSCLWYLLAHPPTMFYQPSTFKAIDSHVVYNCGNQCLNF